MPIRTFDPALQAEYARGYPHLRLLSDEQVPTRKAKSLAKNASEAIDPFLPYTVPRTVARRFLQGYRYRPFRQKEELRAALANDDEPTVDLLNEVIQVQFAPNPLRGTSVETYDFRMAESMFLFEAFLGTETVVDALVEMMVTARDNPDIWAEGRMRDHEHSGPTRLVPVLGWLGMRLEPDRWADVLERLVVDQPALPNYSAALRMLVDPDAGFQLDIAMQQGRIDAIDEHIRYPIYDSYFYWLAGPERLLTLDVSDLPRDPKWQQQLVVSEFGAIAEPGVIRIMAELLSSRSVADEARAWFEKHADWVARQLDDLDDATVQKVEETLGKPAPAKRSAADLRRELERTLDNVGEQLAAADSPTAELHVLREAYANYESIRAALGDPTPGAYFTHELADRFGRWSDDEEVIHRWADLSVQACE